MKIHVVSIITSTLNKTIWVLSSTLMKPFQSLEGLLFSFFLYILSYNLVDILDRYGLQDEGLQVTVNHDFELM